MAVARSSPFEVLVHRIVEGEHPWGRFRATSAEGRTDRVALDLYEPGASADERRNVRMWRWWRGWGGALWILTVGLVCLAARTPHAALDATLGYAAAFIVVSVMTRSRCHVLRMRATRVSAATDALEDLRYQQILIAGTALEAADDALHAGNLTAAQHEVFWRTIWMGLAPSGGPERA